MAPLTGRPAAARRPKGIPKANLQFLAGGGVMGARMRAFDWTRTPLGPPEHWPQSLKTIVRVMLDSRYAMWMLWGPELTFFCNDAYLPTLGIKRDWALGARSDKVWEEIWPDIGPRITQVLKEGRATWDDALLLFLERSGFPEETYHTFSYSPVYDDESRIAGMLCVVTEVTDKVIGEQRLRILRDLAARALGVTNPEESCRRACQVLEEHPFSMPFAGIYFFNPSSIAARRIACTRVFPEHVLPDLLDESSTSWPIAALLASETVQHLAALPVLGHSVTAGPWPDLVRDAFLLPLKGSGGDPPVGFLVVGASPRRVLDETYRSFFELVAGQIAAAISDAQALETERRRAEALAELDRAKTTFFSNVSHELRTPLTLMLGPIAEAVAHPSTSTSVRAQLELAHHNSLRLLKLVNSLLDFARIEAGRMQASYEPTDLPALTRDLASTFQSATERAGLTYAVECSDLGEPAFVDRGMWEKVVLNLLSNAFKYTFEGTISVRMVREASNAVLEVSDTGVGIPEHELPRLFERFHRVEGAAGRTQEGSGIGLALVQELVKLHGGTIGAESKLGSGTTFRVALPFGSAHLPAERIKAPGALASSALGAQAFVQEALRWIPADPSASTASFPALVDSEGPPLDQRFARTAGARILIADDNADMRTYLQGLLSPAYRIEAAADGAQALEAARRERPDLILSDIMMPRLDGRALLKALRGDEALRDVPVVLLSARAGEEARVEGLDAGADDYLVKPFLARELLARVGALLELTQMRREHEERLRLALASIQDQFYLLDRQWRYSLVNPRVTEITGRTEADLIGHSIFELFPDLKGTPLESELRAVFERGEPRRFEFEYGRLQRCFEHVIYPAADGVAVLVTDITERKRTEEALREREEQLRLATESAEVGHWDVDVIAEKLFWPPRVKAMFGISPEVPVSMADFYAGLHPADRERASAAFAAALDPERRALYDVEYRTVGKEDGQIRWVAAKGRGIFDLSGRCIRVIGTAIDITARKLYEAEAQRAMAQLAAIVESSDDAIVSKTLEGIIQTWNAGAERIFGWTADEAIGRPITLIIPPDRVHEEDRILGMLNRGERIHHFETLRLTKDGRQVHVSLTISPVRDSAGRIIGASKIARDITVRKHAERLLQEHEQALREADQRKDEFLAMLAHELRNPLAPIGNASAILSQMLAGDERARLVIEMIKRQVTQLTRLVDDLLDVSRITQGRIELEQRPVDLAAVITQSLETVEPRLREKGHKLSVTASSYEPLYVCGDFARLVQCVGNILTNAIKYTEPQGQISVRTHGDEHRTYIEISDTGAGIAPELLPRVFELFVQSERTLDRSQGGLGIGLAVVKRLVEMHKGEVSARSAGVGQGTSFEIRLPRIAKPAPAAVEAASLASAPRRVLIVDDNKDAANSLAMLLKLQGHEIEVAYNAKDALACAESFKPDVGLLDIGLPEMHGYELAQRLRGRSQLKGLRLVALTGYGQSEDRQRALAAGFDDHLVKPIDLPTLERILAGT